MRGTLKGALAALVLFLLGILIWLLIEQFQETLEQEHLASVHYSADLADHISLSLALKAEPPSTSSRSTNSPAPQASSKLWSTNCVQWCRMCKAWPCSAQLAILCSTAVAPALTRLLKEWVRSNPPQGRGDVYYYGNNHDASVIYLRLRPPNDTFNGYWLLRLSTGMLHSLTRRTAENNRPQWLIENGQTDTVCSAVWQPPPAPALSPRATKPRRCCWCL